MTEGQRQAQKRKGGRAAKRKMENSTPAERARLQQAMQPNRPHPAWMSQNLRKNGRVSKIASVAAVAARERSVA